MFQKILWPGLVIVTGCCHPMIHKIIDFSDHHLKPPTGYYGLYGGLHIALMERWNPKFDKMIEAIARSEFEKIGSNHCTGLIAVRKMIERHLAVYKGTGSYGSKSDLYIGNGDQIEFSSMDVGGIG